MKRAGTLCSICNERPRVVYASGPNSRCRDCLHDYQKDLRERKKGGSVVALQPPVDAQPASRSALYGILSDMTLLVDHAREECRRGRTVALRVALDVDGTRVHMGVEQLSDEIENGRDERR